LDVTQLFFVTVFNIVYKLKVVFVTDAIRRIQADMY